MEILTEFPIPASELRLKKYVASGVLGDPIMEEIALRILIFSQETGEYVKVSSNVLFDRYTEEEKIALERAEKKEEQEIISFLFGSMGYFAEIISDVINDLREKSLIKLEKGKDNDLILMPTPELVARIA